MSDRAMYCYPWDLLDEGTNTVVQNLKKLHIETLTVAGSYHSGKFLRPRAKENKVFFPEGGTVYFRPTTHLYNQMLPKISSITEGYDVFGELCSLRKPEVIAWMVLLHNTRLGLEYPGNTIKNAFGDAYHFALCPSNLECRHYAKTLCQDISEQYPVAALSLETAGFLSFEHGYHHEFELVKTNVWLRNLLTLCFCPSCLAASQSHGIDSLALQKQVRRWVHDYLASDVDYGDGISNGFFVADLVQHTELTKFIRWRSTVVTSLVSEIRGVVRDDCKINVIAPAIIPTANSWIEGYDLEALSIVADAITVCFYDSNIETIKANVSDLKKRIKKPQAINAILRPAYPDNPSQESLSLVVNTLLENGIDNISFYNYGHLKASDLNKMAVAILQGKGAL